MKRGGHDSCGVQRNERRDVAGAIRGLLYMARPASDVHGGSLSDVRAGTGDLCKGGDEGKRVATIAASVRNACPISKRDRRRVSPGTENACISQIESLSDPLLPRLRHSNSNKHVPLRPHSGWHTSQWRVWATWTCCNMILSFRVCDDLNPLDCMSLTQKRESSDVSSTAIVKFPAQAR